MVICIDGVEARGSLTMDQVRLSKQVTKEWITVVTQVAVTESVMNAEFMQHPKPTVGPTKLGKQQQQQFHIMLGGSY